jgi:hypothetical protein
MGVVGVADIDLDAIEAYCAAATEGPWELSGEWAVDPQGDIARRMDRMERVPIAERCPEGEGRAIRWALDLAAARIAEATP